MVSRIVKPASLSEWTDQLNPFNSIKILCWASKIEDAIIGRAPNPITVNIDLSNICNHDCVWCYSKEYNMHNPFIMSKRLIKRIASDLFKLKVKSVILSGGGEPLTNPYFEYAISTFAKKSIEVGLKTNGSLLHNISLKELHKLKYIRVSLDGGSKSYSILHQPKDTSTFNKVIENVRRVTKNKPKSLTVGIGFLAHDLNIKEVVKTCKLTKAAGVDYFEVRLIKEKPLSKRHRKLLSKINQLCLKMQNDKFKVYFIIHKEAKAVSNGKPVSKCYSSWLVSAISPNGIVYPCCELRGIYPIFRIKNNKSFYTFCKSKERKVLLNQIKPSNCPHCRFSAQNEIIEQVFINDAMHRNFF